jgi:hypothetical protein
VDLEKMNILLDEELKGSDKRKATLKKKYGIDWEKDIEPTVKKMKKHKHKDKIDNPYALRIFQVMKKKGFKK